MALLTPSSHVLQVTVQDPACGVGRARMTSQISINEHGMDRKQEGKGQEVTMGSSDVMGWTGLVSTVGVAKPH